MPDVFDANGLQVATAAEITATLTTGLQGIYGNDINVDQNSEDGQAIGIITQIAVDLRELLVQINASFDPDQALGITLDQRVAINNIRREGGTYTTQPIDITANATVSLKGLDGNAANPLGTGYTVQDQNGNKFILLDSTTINAGVTSLNFRAQTIGAVNVPINTITVPVTILAPVTAVNNSSAAIFIGQNQETQPQLRTRRAQSVANATNGYLNGLLGLIKDLVGVTDAELYENIGDTVDANGIPGHGIWLVVEGGANTDIANTIYGNRGAGSNMKGSVVVNKITASGRLFPIRFDRPSASNLYIRFSIQTTSPGYSFDLPSIKAFIAANLKYGIGGFAETSAVTAQAVSGIAAQGGGGVPVLVEISSDDITYTDYLAAPTLASEWTLDPSRIAITVIP